MHTAKILAHGKIPFSGSDRRVAADDRPVGVEQHQVVEVVDVVAVVQGRAAAGRHDVARQVPQRRHVLVADVVLHRRVGRPGAAVLGEDVVAEAGVDLAGRRGEAVAEEGAVRAADGVRAGEDDQLLGGEALGGEVADELGDVERGAREVVLRSRRPWPTRRRRPGGRPGRRSRFRLS